MSQDNGQLAPGGTSMEGVCLAAILLLLWMGTHPKAPARISSDEPGLDGLLLGEWLAKNQDALGCNVTAEFGPTLPFLFKVLSIDRALSIQAHPNKQHASALHAERPDLYPDANHKPELAIALTEFEALCGFRPVEEILFYLHEVREFLTVVGQDAVDMLINAEMASEPANKKANVAEALQRCFSCVMECDPDVVRAQLSLLTARMNECHNNRQDTTPYLGRLFLRIHEQYPGDVGCFVIYFLNYMKLEPFESIFLGPNVAHAYLKGDIVECMACSDNVVRAGLTDKYMDVRTLCNMLDYSPRSVEESKFKPHVSESDPHVVTYDPPVDDFAVRKIQLSAGTTSSFVIRPLNGPSILLGLSGVADIEFEAFPKNDSHGVDRGCARESHSMAMRKGVVLFVEKGAELCLRNIDFAEEVLVFQAYCDVGS